MPTRSRLLPTALVALVALAPCARAAQATIVNDTRQNLVVEVSDTEAVTCTLASGARLEAEPPFPVKGRFLLHQNNRCTLTFKQTPRFKVGPMAAGSETWKAPWLDEFYIELRIWRCRKDQNSTFTHQVSAAGLGDTITLQAKP